MQVYPFQQLSSRFILQGALLASTLFLPSALLATVFHGANSAQTTGANGDIVEVAADGQITSNVADAVQVNSNNAQVIIDSNNTFAGVNAIEATGSGFDAINILAGQTGASITIGQNSGVHATNTNSYAINMAATSRAITNAGTIQSDQDTAINIASSVSVNNGLTNSGTILNNANGSATILVGTGATLTPGILNSGTIANSGGGRAIDLSAANTAAAFTQTAGLVTGDIYLASTDATGGGNVFIVSGGTIENSVHSQSSVNNMLSLTNGKIGGNVDLGNLGDTFDVVRSQLDGALNGGTGVDTLNVNGSFTANGPIDSIESINVSNSGTLFQLNAPITNLNVTGTGLTINSSAIMVDTSNIAGTAGVTIAAGGELIADGTPTIDLSAGFKNVTNNGTLYVPANSVLSIKTKISPALFDSFNSTLAIGLQGSPNALTAGEVVITSANTVNLAGRSMIKPIIENGFIPDGTTFTIVSDPSSSITDFSFVQQTSNTVNFTKALTPGNKSLQLTAHRNSFSLFSSTQTTLGVAATLDNLAQGNGPTNSTLMNLISQFDQLSGVDVVEEAMETLTPPYNYGLVAGSYFGANAAFNAVQTRIEDLMNRRYRPQHKKAKQAKHSTTEAANAATSGTYDVEKIQDLEEVIDAEERGKNFGDLNQSGSWWGELQGGYLDQKERQGIAGFRGKALGAIIGGDWGVTDCTTLGAAASYTHVVVDDRNGTPKDIGIHSWQGMGYGWWEFKHGVYLDAMAAAAWNQYHTNRRIAVNLLNTTSQGDFDGFQWGAQSDLGWDVALNDEAYFVPFTRLKYLQLHLEDYQETGAGALSLNVQNSTLQVLMGGAGLRVGGIIPRSTITWIPEISAMYGYDFINDAEQTVANFLGGGPAFATNGIKPGHSLIDVGALLDVKIGPHSVLTFKYDLELRNQFDSHVGYIKYNYLWS